MFLVVGWRDISARAREEELKMTEVSRHFSIAGWWYVPPSRQPEIPLSLSLLTIGSTLSSLLLSLLRRYNVNVESYMYRVLFYNNQKKRYMYLKTGAVAAPASSSATCTRDGTSCTYTCM